MRSCRILFVCAGNTCRSPLAAALARAEAAGRGWSRVEVDSAGVRAEPGAPASDPAIRVAARHGLSLEEHRARKLTRERLRGPCRVLVMSAAQLATVGSAMPGADVALVTDLLPESDSRRSRDVPDPFGQEDDAYERAFDTLHSAVAALFDRLEREDDHGLRPI